MCGIATTGSILPPPPSFLDAKYGIFCPSNFVASSGLYCLKLLYAYAIAM
jgi:hypothetical protein